MYAMLYLTRQRSAWHVAARLGRAGLGKALQGTTHTRSTK